MRSLTSTNGGWLRNTTAGGLVPLLLLASLLGCTARHLPDWSTVQAVKPNTKTEVTLYKERTLPTIIRGPAESALSYRRPV